MYENEIGTYESDRICFFVCKEKKKIHTKMKKRYVSYVYKKNSCADGKEQEDNCKKYILRERFAWKKEDVML